MVISFEDWLCRAREAKRMALISHVNPDGDTVGSVLALRLAFLSLGKAVDIVCDGQVPENMLFLEGADQYIRPEEATDDYDTVIAVDVSCRELLGKSVELFDRVPMRMVIDHHATNPAYGEVNFLRGGESACCLLAYEAVVGLGVQITPAMANCLMLGMSTDTGHFQYPSTSPATLIAAGKLLAAGADISFITRQMYRTQARNRVELTRIAYNKMHFEGNGTIGVIMLTKEDYDSTGCTFSQGDGLVNKALEVEGVRMAVLGSERDDGIKMSLRAVEPDDVSKVALCFGGGGHKQASGCTIYNASLEEATAMVVEEMKRQLGVQA